MPNITRIFDLISSALQGLPVSVEITGTTGSQSVRVQINPGAESADEESPTGTVGTGETGFTVVPTAVATTQWWEVTTPLQPGPHVLALSSQLRASGDLSAAERIRLAYGRGRQGASIYRGEATHFTGDRSSLRNRCYVVLRARHHQQPFFTWNLNTHQEAVRPPPGDFDHQAISHGFASQAEARAFCLGAGLPDLANNLE